MTTSHQLAADIVATLIHLNQQVQQVRSHCLEDRASTGYALQIDFAGDGSIAGILEGFAESGFDADEIEATTRDIQKWIEANAQEYQNHKAVSAAIAGLKEKGVTRQYMEPYLRDLADDSVQYVLPTALVNSIRATTSDDGLNA